VGLIVMLLAVKSTKFIGVLALTRVVRLGLREGNLHHPADVHA